MTLRSSFSMILLTSLAACQRIPDGRAGMGGIFPLKPAGPVRPSFLYPRHRITSAAPPLILFVPGDQGPVEIELEIDAGRSRRIRTRDRYVPWPAEWPVLNGGESGTAVLRTGGQLAFTAFWRAEPEAPDLGGRGRDGGVPERLERGLPMEAARLAAWSLDRSDAAGVAWMRAGTGGLGLWRRR